LQPESFAPRHPHRLSKPSPNLPVSNKALLVAGLLKIWIVPSCKTRSISRFQALRAFRAHIQKICCIASDYTTRIPVGAFAKQTVILSKKRLQEKADYRLSPSAKNRSAAINVPVHRKYN
jgi:hypothetical protein